MFDDPWGKFPAATAQEGLALLGDECGDEDESNNAAGLTCSATFGETEAFCSYGAWSPAVGVHDKHDFKSGIDGGHQEILADEPRVGRHRLGFWTFRAGTGEFLYDCLKPSRV